MKIHSINSQEPGFFVKGYSAENNLLSTYVWALDQKSPIWYLDDTGLVGSSNVADYFIILSLALHIIENQWNDTIIYSDSTPAISWYLKLNGTTRTNTAHNATYAELVRLELTLKNQLRKPPIEYRRNTFSKSLLRA